MKRSSRALLSLLGIAAFLALWQVVIEATRPGPIRPVVLGFSDPQRGTVRAVVLGARGEVLAEDSLTLGADSATSNAERLGAWLFMYQPTVAALPPSSSAAETLRVALAQAQQRYGGGLALAEVGVAAGGTRAAALERARSLQIQRSRRASWIPAPGEAARALVQMARSGELMRHTIASLFRVAAGFSIAVAVGIPLGLGLGSLAWLSALLNGILQGLRPISPIAWLPVATLLLGGGDVAAIFLIFLASFFPIVVSTAAAVGTVDLKYRRSALNFGIRGVALARRVVLPAVFPQVLTALRVALGISWVVVVAAEMLGVESGLGFLVLDARNQLRYDRVVAAMIVIGVIGLCLDVAIRRFERIELERRGLAAR